jgi:O-antigen ligase
MAFVSLKPFWRQVALVAMAIAVPAVLITPLSLWGVGLGLVMLMLSEPRESWQLLRVRMLSSQTTALACVALCSLLASSLSGVSPAYAFGRWQVVMLLVLAAAVLCHALGRLTFSEFRIFWRILAGAVVASMVLALGVALFVGFWVHMGLVQPGVWKLLLRLQMFSHVLVILLPFVWLWNLKMPDGRLAAGWKQLALIAAGISLAVVCGGVAGVVESLAVYAAFVLMAQRFYGLKTTPQLLVCVGGVALVAGVAGYAWVRGMAPVETLLAFTMPSMAGMENWQVAWEHMLDRPMFGIGISSFRFLPGANFHPHNAFLQLGLEGGFMGFIFCAWLVGVVVWKTYLKAMQSPVAMAAFASNVGFIMGMLVHDSLFSPITLAGWLMVVALGLAQGNPGKEETKGQKKGKNKRLAD